LVFRSSRLSTTWQSSIFSPSPQAHSHLLMCFASGFWPGLNWAVSRAAAPLPCTTLHLAV
jgi:hypothetical protein